MSAHMESKMMHVLTWTEMQNNTMELEYYNSNLDGHTVKINVVMEWHQTSEAHYYKYLKRINIMLKKH